MFTKSHLSIFVSAIALAITGSVQVASAAYLEGVMSGLIETIDPGMQTTAQVGDRVSVTYLVDLDAPDFWPNSSPIDGVYHLSSLTLEVGNDSIGFRGPDIVVFVRPWYPIKNEYAVQGRLPNEVAGITSPFIHMSLNTWDLDPPPLLDDSIPMTLDIADFEWNRILLYSRDDWQPRIIGNIDFISFRTTPEPNTLAMVVAALAFSGRRARARR